MKTRTYEVLKDCIFAGAARKAGDKVELSTYNPNAGYMQSGGFIKEVESEEKSSGTENDQTDGGGKKEASGQAGAGAADKTESTSGAVGGADKGGGDGTDKTGTDSAGDDNKATPKAKAGAKKGK